MSATMKFRAKRATLFLRTASLLAVGLIELLSSLAAAGADTPADGPKRVLILESFGRDFALWNAVPPAFKPELAQQLPWPI